MKILRYRTNMLLTLLYKIKILFDYIIVYKFLRKYIHQENNKWRNNLSLFKSFSNEKQFSYIILSLSYFLIICLHKILL